MDDDDDDDNQLLNDIDQNDILKSFVKSNRYQNIQFNEIPINTSIF